MDLIKFYENVEAEPELEGICVVKADEPKDDYIAILHKTTEHTWQVLVDTVLTREWKLLRDILIGKREPTVLTHMTRIVGYFSKVGNFNKSKLSELRDRVAGNYRTDGKPRENRSAANAVIDRYSNGDKQ